MHAYPSTHHVSAPRPPWHAQAALVRTVPPPRTANGAPPPAGAAGAAPSLPLDWAHLHRSHGITHFAALPLYHGSNLAGALTILGSTSAGGGGGGPGNLADPHSTTAVPQLVSIANSSAHGLTQVAAANASGGGGGGGAGGGGGGAASLDALFRAPLSLELVGMAVAQCCLGADMALACHAVEMVQAMHACASIQQLVAGISLGLQVGCGLEGRRRGEEGRREERKGKERREEERRGEGGGGQWCGWHGGSAESHEGKRRAEGRQLGGRWWAAAGSVAEAAVTGQATAAEGSPAGRG